MERISRSHDKFKLMKDMIKTNHYPNLTVTDDLEVLKIAVNNNLKIELLFYSFDLEYQDETKKLLNELIKNSKEVYEISKSSYDSIKLKENHAGIIGAIQLKEYNYNAFKDKEFLMVLDHLEIPGNIGTIYRTLDSINCDGVLLVDSISKINNEKITSSSRGCNLIIPTISDTYQNVLKYLLDNDYEIFLGEPKLGLNYQEYNYKGKIAIVVGNERFGINNDWYNHKSTKVFIPMEGSQNSLNVSVAASILAYEAYMKRKA
ncbi:MAG: RNA methyltransferase [Acholeplasmatales bacterium]|nr:RNA methyltransferase [Acholeplasmatales bacterium]